MSYEAGGTRMATGIESHPRSREKGLARQPGGLLTS